MSSAAFTAVRTSIEHSRLNSVWRNRHRDRPPICNGERLLVCEPTPDGGELLATDQALYVPSPPTSDGGCRRIEWVDVRAVGQSREPSGKAVMSLRLRTPSEEFILLLPVAARSKIPDLAVERSSASVIIRCRERMSDSSVVTFTARRDPGTGRAKWTVESAHAGDRIDPGLHAEVERTLREIRSQTGC